MKMTSLVLLQFMLLGGIATASSAEELEIACDSQYANYGSGESILNLCTDGSYSNVAYNYGSGTVYYDGTYGGGFIPVSPEGPPTHVQGVDPIPDGEIGGAESTSPTIELGQNRPTAFELAVKDSDTKGAGTQKLAPPYWVGIATMALCHANQQAVVAQLIAACVRRQEERRPTRPATGPSSVNAGYACGWGARVHCP